MVTPTFSFRVTDRVVEALSMQPLNLPLITGDFCHLSERRQCRSHVVVLHAVKKPKQLQPDTLVGRVNGDAAVVFHIKRFGMKNIFASSPLKVTAHRWFI